MSNEAKPPIIVIKRIKKGGHGHHGGAWKVAYADFVTAMMALFLVLWLVASDTETKKAVGGYFQDPTGTGKLQGSTQAGAGEGLSLAKNDLKDLKDKIEQAMKTLPKLEQLKSSVTMTVTNEGLRIELIENKDGTFFQSGNASPTDSAREMLKLLAEQLKLLPNKVLIEGHTDAKPYASDSYSNWELSTDRANSARRLMQESGLPRDHVAQVRGFADQQLRDPKQPESSSNRRVSVLVKYADGPEAAPEAAAPAGKTSHAAPAPAKSGH